MNATTKDIPKRFVVNIMDIMFRSPTAETAVEPRPSYNLVDHYFNKLELENLHIGDQRVKLFLAILFENNLQLPATFKHNEISINAMNCSHQELYYLMRFLDLLDYKGIGNFKISVKDRSFTLKEFQKLTSYLLHSSKVEICNTNFPAGSFSCVSSGIVNVNIRPELVDQTDECNADKSTGNFLQILCFEKCSITDADVINLLPCIVYLKKLSLNGSLAISCTPLTLLSDIIIESKEDCKLQVLNLSYCNLQDEGVIKLSPCITYLKSLNLCGNMDISGASLTQISDIIIQSKTICKLEVLNLSYCNLHDEDVIKLAPCITYLKKLYLYGNNNLSGASLTLTSDIIIQSREHCKLEELNLSDCNLHDEDVIKLSPCITYLNKLNLSVNKNLSGASLTQISDVIIQSDEQL